MLRNLEEREREREGVKERLTDGKVRHRFVKTLDCRPVNLCNFKGSERIVSYSCYLFIKPRNLRICWIENRERLNERERERASERESVRMKEREREREREMIEVVESIIISLKRGHSLYTRVI